MQHNDKVMKNLRYGERKYGFCKDVVTYLIESKWDGNVILEYLFEFHDQILSDLGFLRAMQ